MKQAKKLLGRNFSIYGVVKHGHKIGEKLGYKTANLDIEDDYSILLSGVFATTITHDGTTYKGVANVGYRPTFWGEKHTKQVEVFIFDFNKEIYGEKIYIEFIEFIRKERKFNSSKELSAQIKLDVKKAENIFKNQTD